MQQAHTVTTREEAVHTSASVQLLLRCSHSAALERLHLGLLGGFCLVKAWFSEPSGLFLPFLHLDLDLATASGWEPVELHTRVCGIVRVGSDTRCQTDETQDRPASR